MDIISEIKKINYDDFGRIIIENELELENIVGKANIEFLPEDGCNNGCRKGNGSCSNYNC